MRITIKQIMELEPMPMPPLQVLIMDHNLERDERERAQYADPFAPRPGSMETLNPDRICQVVMDEINFWATHEALPGADLRWLLHHSLPMRLDALRGNELILNYRMEYATSFSIQASDKGIGHSVFFYTGEGESRKALWGHRFHWSSGNLIRSWAKVELEKKHTFVTLNFLMDRDKDFPIIFNSEGGIERVGYQLPNYTY